MNSKLMKSCILLAIALSLVLTQRRMKPESPAQASAPRAADLNQASTPIAPELASVKEARVSEAYGELPLSFEANSGQTASQRQFLSRGDGYGLFLTSGEAVLVLSKPDVNRGKQAGHMLKSLEARTAKSEDTMLRIKLLDANPAAKGGGLDELPGKSNYFIGNDPSKWRTGVPNYARVQYKDVYPGVDLAYYGSQRQLEYDLIVSPGADPGVIKLRFEGAQKVHLNAKGDLVLRTAVGEVRNLKPVVYQEVEGARQTISGRYILRGKGEVGFEVDAYDRGKPLVIDPVLSYSTYLGGSNFEVGSGVAVDSLGNAYVVGNTNSSDFPISPGGFQTAYGGGTRDAFVAKLNPSGSALVYSTYLGGSSNDGGTGIAVDGYGNAYITGATGSVDFPTLNPVQPTFGGVQDAFIVKLDPTGSALVYSTYLGGSDFENAGGIAVDSLGDAYVTGNTNSSDFPTSNALQPIFGNASTGFIEPDAFVAKLNPSGSALIYSTYLGGNRLDAGLGIAVDSSGNAYVIGTTLSTNFPIVNALQASPGGGADAFVAKLNAAGSALVYSTYLGGSGDEQGSGIAVDSSGNAYVTGNTSSLDFPVVNAFQPAYGGGSRDAFVAKLNAAGSALVYSTYLGGGDLDSGSGIALDSSGNAYVIGTTLSTNFPVTNALQATLRGVDDAFVTKLDPTGATLLYSTYFGGSGIDAGLHISVDSSANAYIIGNTNSTDFPLSSPLQRSFGGGFLDAFVAKISSQLPNRPPTAICGNVVKAADTNCRAAVTAQEVNNGSFDPDGDPITLSLSPSGPYSLGETTVTLTVTDNHGASSQCTATVTVVDTTPPTITCPSNITVELASDAGAAVTFPTPSATDNCGVASVVCVPPSGSVFPIGTTTVTCAATDSSTNKANCTFIVRVVPPPTARGSFVIGDLNAVIGRHVTFWGAQWAKLNSLSGGPAPASFKGFAESGRTNLPSCGDAWTSDPGNSSGPPTSIPSYIAVIVSGSITKSGPTIAGNTQRVVIVKTNPGYASNPGHAGTGTVVGVICP